MKKLIEFVTWLDKYLSKYLWRTQDRRSTISSKSDLSREETNLTEGGLQLAKNLQNTTEDWEKQRRKYLEFNHKYNQNQNQNQNRQPH